MIIAFELTMPSVGSWNGKWTGDKDLFAKCRTLSKPEAERLLGDGMEKNFSYRWDDGWCASIRVRKIDSSEKKVLERKSSGFCGYDWMIDSIIEHGNIITEG
jgi:hypothetical protein